MDKAEKDACLPVIALLLESIHISRRQGLLALQALVNQQEDNAFFVIMMSLVMDGADPLFVKSIGENLMFADGHTRGALLTRKIITEGALSVLAGENPRIAEIKMLSLLGEDYLMQRKSLFCDSLFVDFDQRLAALTRGDILPEAAVFENAVSRMDDEAIGLMLRSTDPGCLALALKGCCEATAKKLLGRLLPRLANAILESMEGLNVPSAGEIKAAQEGMMAVGVG
jgi:hypothetical protein